MTSLQTNFPFPTADPTQALDITKYKHISIRKLQELEHDVEEMMFLVGYVLAEDLVVFSCFISPHDITILLCFCSFYFL
jgi:hypothetical protein